MHRPTADPALSTPARRGDAFRHLLGSPRSGNRRGRGATSATSAIAAIAATAATAATATILAVALLGLAPAPAQNAVAPELRSVLDGLVAALRAGDVGAYESFVQAHFSSQILARRTAADRQQFLTRFHGEFGAFEVTSESIEPPQATLALRPQRGKTTGKLHVVFEAAAPYKIQELGLGVDVGGDDEPKTALPPLPELAGVAPPRLGGLLDPYLQRLADADSLSGVVLVARDGEAIFEHAYGMADREAKRPNRVDTRFNIASIGKQFTHVAIGQLLMQGKVALGDPVAKYLPAYPNAAAAQKMTVRQLLDHQAGVVDIFDVVKPGDAPPRSNHEWFGRVASQPLDFEPGAETRYCNGCYVVLGEIVAAVSGLPYEECLAQHVFAPAGMTMTAFLDGSAASPAQAMGYSARQGGGGLERTSLGPGGRGSGAGGVFSTASDLLAYANALRGERLLDHQRTNWMLGGGDEGAPARASLGVAGGAPGVSTVLESDGTWTVIVLTNRDPQLGEQLGVEIAKALRR